MLSIMAKYFHKTTGKKVLVLVPSEVLKLDQTRLYCPDACRAATSLYDPKAPSEIWYSTFERVLCNGTLLENAIILVDEFHSFFHLPARMVQGIISSPFSLLMGCHKVIGVSATFGGD